MGKTTRRKFTPEFKAKVALEALKESSTKGELARMGAIQRVGCIKNEYLEVIARMPTLVLRKGVQYAELYQGKALHYTQN